MSDHYGISTSLSPERIWSPDSAWSAWCANIRESAFTRYDAGFDIPHSYVRHDIFLRKDGESTQLFREKIVRSHEDICIARGEAPNELRLAETWNMRGLAHKYIIPFQNSVVQNGEPPPFWDGNCFPFRAGAIKEKEIA